MYHPSYDPDVFISVEDLYRPHLSSNVPDNEEMHLKAKYSTQYSSKSVRLLLDWQNTGSSAKTNDEVNCLVYKVLYYLEFQLDALWSFNPTCENWKADTAEELAPFLWSFQYANIDIEVPSGNKEVPSRNFTVPGLYHWNIITLIKEAFDSHLSRQFISHPSSYFRHFLVVKTANTCTLRCTIWTCFWTSMIGSNMCQLTILLASERRLSRASCSGLMLCVLQPSVQPRCSRYTCSLGASWNISNANQILAL